MSRLPIAVRAAIADCRGTSAVEFALVGPVLLVFVLLLIEGGRMEWTQQALFEVATESARCMALATTSCNSTSAIQTYTRALAQARGISLANATITVSSNQTCNSVTGMNEVAISLPYQVMGGLLPAGPSTLQASACFPSVS
jgi:Flp pilus assembly protein TadG